MSRRAAPRPRATRCATSGRRRARGAFRGASDAMLRKFLAARATVPTAATDSARSARPLDAAVVPLGGNALCLIPSTHAALRSSAAAQTLVDALAAALGLDS